MSQDEHQGKTWFYFFHYQLTDVAMDNSIPTVQREKELGSEYRGGDGQKHEAMSASKQTT